MDPKELVFDHKRLKDANYELKDPSKLSMYFVGLNDSMKRELCMV